MRSTFFCGEPAPWIFTTAFLQLDAVSKWLRLYGDIPEPHKTKLVRFHQLILFTRNLLWNDFQAVLRYQLGRWNSEVSDRRRSRSAGVAAKLCIVVHGGSCCLQSTSAKKSLSAFSQSRRHQIRILFYYSTTYRTQFQYIFMPPTVKCSFNR